MLFRVFRYPPETGVVEVVRYTTVDDCGRAVNPMILHGQTHGGIAQGVGQALWESCAYDPVTGQLLAATLMDYALPHAANFPMFELHRTTTPTHLNPMGVKGIGEAGTIGAAPAVINAVVDALSGLGVRDVPMPASPHHVWEAIRSASPS